MGGNGPGDHPGVVIVTLTGIVADDTAAIEAALETKAEFQFTYQAGGSLFAVFATKY